MASLFCLRFCFDRPFFSSSFVSFRARIRVRTRLHIYVAAAHVVGDYVVVCCCERATDRVFKRANSFKGFFSFDVYFGL